MIQITLALITIGAIFVLLAIVKMCGILRLLYKNNLKLGAWKILFALLWVFLLGFIASVFIIYSEQQKEIIFLTGTMFFLGGVFAFILARINTDSFRELISKTKMEETQAQKEFDNCNLNSLINSTTDLMWSADRNLGLITANNAFDEILKRITGRTIEKGDNVLPTELGEGILERWRKHYARALSGETFIELEYSKKPVESWVEISLYPMRKEDEIIGVACYSRNITEQKRAEIKIIQSENQIRNFATHINQVLEDERSRMARELHDELGQQLAGIKISLSSLKKEGKVQEAITGEVNILMKDIEGAIQSVRRIATELRPGILDTLGLPASIQWLADEFEKKTNIECKVEMNVEGKIFEKNISTCFFRICQEALTNIIKHAEASEVVIHLNQNQNQLTLNVSDNGKGISNEKMENPFSLGLLGMYERANIIGAHVLITSKKGLGTSIQLNTNIN